MTALHSGTTARHRARRASQFVLAPLALLLGALAGTAGVQVASVDLGTLGGNGEAVAISDSGQVVGWSEHAGERHAFSWTATGGMIDLGSSTSEAVAVNANGQVVGRSGSGAFSWTAGGGLIILGAFSGSGGSSRALAVNDGGQVVGWSSAPGSEAHPFSWTVAGGMIDLGTFGGSFSRAVAVNDSGQVVGSSGLAGDETSHAFLWTDVSGLVDLTPWLTSRFSESGALALNASGQVVGFSEDHAFSWTATGGLIDLGTLGGVTSRAVAVNDSGQVVGWSSTAGVAPSHAFSWTAVGGMIDLGTLGGSSSEAYAVNDRGQVVGSSLLADGTAHAFSWTAAGGMVDLGTLGGGVSWVGPAGFRDPYPPCTQDFPCGDAVNASGQVAGGSDLALGGYHPALWQVGPVLTIASLRATPNVLWPPNHKMVPVSVAVSASDGSAVAPVCQITAVSSSEPITVPGAGDWVISGTRTVLLRAERAGSGKGRVYTITVTCRNASGLSAAKDVTVRVPHDQSR